MGLPRGVVSAGLENVRTILALPDYPRLAKYHTFLPSQYFLVVTKGQADRPGPGRVALPVGPRLNCRDPR